jgi:periplasmic protein TonB
MPLPSRLTRSLPVSICVHAFVLAAALVIPLTAEIVLPSPATTLPAYMQAVAIPPPPPPAVRLGTRQSRAGTPPASIGAPVVAPSDIGAEKPAAPLIDVPDLGGVSTTAPDLGGLFEKTMPPPVVIPTPSPLKPAGPVRATELIESPRKLVDARPIYPEFARAAHVEGTVILEAVLDPTGHVRQVRVIRSIPLLDQAAVDAVRQWQYTPSRLRGQPVSVLMTVTVTFTLR